MSDGRNRVAELEAQIDELRRQRPLTREEEILRARFSPPILETGSGIDIVERLRLGGPNAAEVADEAADEIERLRAALRDILSRVDHETAYQEALYAVSNIARKALRNELTPDQDADLTWSSDDD